MTKTQLEKLETRNQYLQEQLTLRERQLKKLRRKDMLFDAIMEDVDNLIKPLKALPTRYQLPKRGKDVDTEGMVLHISDSHMDRIVLPSSVQNLESYNFKEAVIRAENLIDGFLKIKERKLTNYNFPVLTILMYGDNTNGEIHDYVSKSAFKNQFKNCFAISNVYALMIRDLAPHFGKINIIAVPGNHGRTTVKKDYEDAHNSWDYMIYESTRLLTKDLGNVEWKIPNSYSTIINIEGYNFFIEHGDDVKAWNGIPYYGIERKTRRILALQASNQMFIQYFVYGHFHTATSMTNLGNSETFINGAWYSTDPYALSMGYHTEPAQWMHGVSPTKGITFRYKVYLKDKRKKEPSRYGEVLSLY